VTLDWGISAALFDDGVVGRMLILISEGSEAAAVRRVRSGKRTTPGTIIGAIKK